MFSECIVWVLSSYNRREDNSTYNLYLYKINHWHVFISEINMIIMCNQGITTFMLMYLCFIIIQFYQDDGPSRLVQYLNQ